MWGSRFGRQTATALVVAAVLLAPISVSHAADPLPAPTPGQPGQPQPAPAPGPMGSGFKSAYPPDRSIQLFSDANPAPPNQMDQYVGVGFDSSARIQLLPYISVEDLVDGPGFHQHLCASIDDPTCQPGDKWDIAMVVSGIGNCAASPQSACVESFSLVKEDGTELKATPVQKFPKDFKEFPGSPQLGFTPGLASWIWRVEGDAPGDQHDYYITGEVQAGGQAVNGKWNIQTNSFFLEVAPIFYEYSNLIKAPERIEQKNFTNPNFTSIFFSNSENGCLANDAGVCLHRRSWPEAVRVKLSLRLPRGLGGWLNGRMSRPVAYGEKINDFQGRLTVEGEPASNILAAKWIKRTDVAPAVYEPINNLPNNPFAGLGKGQTNLMLEDSGMENAVDWYQRWSPYLGETAFSMNKTWTLKNVRKSPESTACDKQVPGLQGIVATNATAYEGTAPKYNQATSTLDYRVAAPHFQPDGKTVNIGRYGLTMNAELLQCLYGVKTLPSVASIGITNSDGTEVVQSVTLKQEKGWVYLNADNFTFSSPKLSVKLQEPAASPATSTPTTNASKKSSITCVKGKTVKKVTAVAPKCPAGYKKK